MSSVTQLNCGRLHGDIAMFEAGTEGRVTLPVSTWLVRHPKGTVLFDCGMPASFVGRTERTDKVSTFLEIECSAGDTVGEQLQAHDQDPGRVDFVVVSHLHFDHVGGLAMIPNATLVIQRSEWDAGMSEEGASRYTREDFDLGHKLKLLDGEYDIFGDDSVVCIPTPGHTVGHQSLRVRHTSGRQVVLTSDCCYFARTLDDGALPTFGHDLDQQRDSLAQLRKLRDAGAVIVPGHDAGFVFDL
ncbi:MAG: N-acyl homoserine lactonase family protein [Rhodospirillaceae bacterium]|jgi:N-acyl homoserine lactone hydrolase|nr:N-acyl homoserine lactonase family protein [Rhodospirillaceae bacterium]